MSTPASPATAGSGRPGGRPDGGGRRRKPPKRVEVVSVSKIAPRLVSIWVGGEDLEAYADAAPTSHLKVFLPPKGQDELLLPTYTPEGLGGAGSHWEHDEALRPVVRTYTPRRYDANRGTVEIQFVLHGVGPASEWAERARVGDQLAIGGPGGRFTLDEAAADWWIAADESAIPALGTLLEALPSSARARVHVEVADADDEIVVSTTSKVSINWHRRGSKAYGATLLDVAGSDGIAPNTRVWVACEAAAMRAIRRRLIAERPILPAFMVTRGYWRVSEENYPDHDYGED